MVTARKSLLAMMVFLLAISTACGATPAATPQPSAPTAVPAAAPASQPTKASPATTAPAPAAPTVAAVKKPEGTIIIAAEDLGTPGGLTDQVEPAGHSILAAVQESLIAVDAQGRLIPELADKWQMSPDGKVITFQIHKGVKFHDGSDLTAEDVKFTIEQMIKETKSINLNSAMFRNIIDSISTPDPYTLVLNMKKVTFDFFYQINNNPPHLTIASKKYVESVGRDQAAKQPLGSGPYKLLEYKADDYAKFEAVENHWRKTAEFKTMIVREVPDPASRVMMLRAGEVDVAGVNLENLAEVESAGFKVLTSTGHPFWINFGGNYLPTREGFNPDLPWVGNPNDPASLERSLKVRKAMNLAVDKEKILRTVMHGMGTLTAVPGMRPDQPGYDPKWKQYPYDPTEAKKLLAEAGYTNGFPVTLQLYKLPGREEYIDIGQAIGTYLTQVGLDVKINIIDYNTGLRPQLVARKVFDLYPYGMSYTEGVVGWNRWGQSKATVILVPEHPWIDEKVAKAVAELDSDKRAAMQREIGQWYIDNAWTIPVATKDTTYAINTKKVKNWGLPPLMGYYTRWEHIERAQ